MSHAVTDLLDCVWRPDSRHVWAENFDRTIDAHFRTQAAVLRAIVSFLSPQIKRAEPDRVRITALNDLTAHELAQQSWTAILSEEMSYESGPRDRAATLAQQILTRDPRSGLAYRTLAWVAWWTVYRGTTGSKTRQRWPKASALLQAWMRPPDGIAMCRFDEC